MLMLVPDQQEQPSRPTSAHSASRHNSVSPAPTETVYVTEITSVPAASTLVTLSPRRLPPLGTDQG